MVNSVYMGYGDHYNETLPDDIFINMTIPISKTQKFKFLGDDKLFTYVGVQPTKDNPRKGLGKQWYDSWIPDYYYSYPLNWWEGQLAAVIYIATTACGITKRHLMHDDPLIRSFYRFHVYYTVKKLLYKCDIPYPGTSGFKGVWNGSSVEPLRQLLRLYAPELSSYDDEFLIHKGDAGQSGLLGDGPDGLKWDADKNYYYYKSKSKGKWVLLDELSESYKDYTSSSDGIFKALAESARHTFNTYDTKYHNIGHQRYPDFEKDIDVDQYKWKTLIPDGVTYDGVWKDMKLTKSTGVLLVKKSLFVFFYSIVTAQSGGDKDLTSESFMKNVNSFIEHDENLEQHDLLYYYELAKTHTNFSNRDKISLDYDLPLLPKDLSIKVAVKESIVSSGKKIGTTTTINKNWKGTSMMNSNNSISKVNKGVISGDKPIKVSKSTTISPELLLIPALALASLLFWNK